MVDEINDLVDAIIHDNVFQNYRKSNQKLKDEQLVSLLTKHQMLQEDYLRLKQYQSYVDQNEIREKLKIIKKEMTQHPDIQAYYQDYYALNELLDQVTRIVFQGISDEIVEAQL